MSTNQGRVLVVCAQKCKNTAPWARCQVFDFLICSISAFFMHTQCLESVVLCACSIR